MTNEEYFAQVSSRIDKLQELRKKALVLVQGIIGETLLQEDLFFSASTDRCIHLMDGFVSMLNARNITCAGVLLRMQMDNCMRTYAAFIAENKNEVVQCIINGNPIKNLKDKNGKKMLDGHLKDEISKLDSLFAQVYDRASGYVHLSETAFFRTVEKCEDGKIDLSFGTPLPEKRNEPLLESADAYIHFVELHFKMLQAVADSKQRYESTQKDIPEDKEE